MNVAPQGIGSALARIDASQVGWANAAARRLARIGIDTRIALAEPGTEEWYLGASFAFRPSAGNRAPLGAAAEVLTAMLSKAEPLLAAVEAAIGHAAEFDDHGALPDAAAALTLMRAGEALGELVVRAALEDTEPPAPRALLALEATAARLGLADAEALGPGDLVILTRGPWPLSAAPDDCPPCCFDPVSGRLGASFPIAEFPQEPTPMSNPHAFASAPAPLAVPVVVRLADLLLAPDEIAAIAAGGTVDLGPVAEGLEVTLSVGGRPIGRGAIVRLGDRFGVLLEEPVPTRAPAAAQATAGDDTATGFVTLESE
jgi:flagellar motor switch/type III secretory pathway protein FliN